MSLLALRQDSEPGPSHRPSGEDYAKGSSYLLWTFLAAFLVVTAAIAGFFLAHRKAPTAAGEVTQVWVHGLHIANNPATGMEPMDQVLVLADLRIRNQSGEPIVLRELMTNVTLDDGPRSSYAATSTDYDRIFLAYPELAGLKGNKLTRDTVLQPGESIEGMLVSSFHCSTEQWAGHKDLSFSVQFKLHPDLVLTPTTPIIEK